MLRLLRVILLAALAFQAATVDARIVIDVVRHGIVADGTTPCTALLQRIIDEAPSGAVIRFPRGQYLTGTLHLRSHITLQLDEGTTLLASLRHEDYDAYRPTHDMSRYDTGVGTRNANLTSDARWTRALILGAGLTDVTIKGKGTIDGRHLSDPRGEEGLRGPHAILLAECSNVSIKDIHVTRAANYAFLGYDLSHATFQGLNITEGWDGIHIRGGKDILIKNCDISTGDDCIAGAYWTNMRVTRCHLNSSCNGIRLIGPADGFEVGHTDILGPGRYPHRTNGLTLGSHSIYGIVIEPGAWGQMPGDVSGVHLHHLTLSHQYSPIAYSMGADNHCHDLTIENVKATHCEVTLPLNRQDCPRMWDSVTLRNVSITGHQ